MKIHLGLEFLHPQLLLDQLFLVKGFDGRLLSTDAVGDEINTGEGSPTKEFPSLVDPQRPGTGGFLHQDFGGLHVTDSSS